MESIRVEDLPKTGRGTRELEVDWNTIRQLPVGFAVELGKEWPHLAEGRRPNSLASILRNHIERKGLHGLKAMQRSTKVYVARTEEEEG